MPTLSRDLQALLDQTDNAREADEGSDGELLMPTKTKSTTPTQRRSMPSEPTRRKLPQISSAIFVARLTELGCKIPVKVGSCSKRRMSSCSSALPNAFSTGKDNHEHARLPNQRSTRLVRR